MHLVAKLSETMQSQQVQQMVDLMEKFLKLKGIQPVSQKLSCRLEAISEGHQPEVARAVELHLLEDLNVNPVNLEVMIREAEPVMAALATQGGETPATSDQKLLHAIMAHLVMNDLITPEQILAMNRRPRKGSVASSLRSAGGEEAIIPAIAPKFIEDVKTFKASMALSSGPVAAQDLGTFEQIDPKL